MNTTNDAAPHFDPGAPAYPSDRLVLTRCFGKGGTTFVGAWPAWKVSDAQKAARRCSANMPAWTWRLRWFRYHATRNLCRQH